MPLDRTWYNTLVDDDGSGMTGSVWDKADVDSLMDAIDAELARLESSGTWSPFSLESYSASGGATLTLNTVTTRLWSFDPVQRRVWIDLYLTVNLAGPSPTFLYITLHTSMPHAAAVHSVPFNYYGSGALAGTGILQTSGGSGATVISLLRDVAGTAWISPQTNMYLSLQFSYTY